MAAPNRVCPKCGATYDPAVIFCPEDGAPLTSRKTESFHDPYLGMTLADQFELERIIGIGAMGRVYRAHQRGIERDVAIKILHRELLQNEAVIQRFHREARVASRLVHPNVVQVLMSGEIAAQSSDVGGEGYLVMEHLDGISLRSALAAAGALPLPRALHIVLQICDAVGEAHAQSIIHRDLKPDNVMLVRRGDDRDFVKVLDFGLAKLTWLEGSVSTQAGAIFGTARYISPEGARGEPVGAAADVYSIATMLFQCLAGQTPFDADSAVAILVKQTSAAPPRLRSIPRASYVPEAIAELIDTNLAKLPKDRCRDARELGRALVEAARAGGLSPDDLLQQSSLMSGRRALQLPSIQRTKSLALSTELAERMAAHPEESSPEHPLQSAEPTLSESDFRLPVRSYRRLAFVAACFVLGVVLTLGAAHGLGVFAPGAEPAPPPSAGTVPSPKTQLLPSAGTPMQPASRSNAPRASSAPGEPLPDTAIDRRPPAQRGGQWL